MGWKLRATPVRIEGVYSADSGSPSDSRAQALARLHLAVLLFGGAGLIGKMLASPALVVACVRSLLAALALAALLHWRWSWNALREHGWLLPVTGALLGVHWWTFFEAIQRGTVGLGLLSFATYPAFVCLLGWLWLGERVGWATGSACVAVMIGLLLLMPAGTPDSPLWIALGFGVISGLTFALLTLGNRRLTRRLSPLFIVTIQTGLAGLVLLPVSMPGILAVRPEDWVWLLVLGIACTAWAHVSFTASLARLEAAIVSITVALEPVYGIALAWMALGERPSWRMAAGGALIIGGAVIAGRSGMGKAERLGGA